MHPALSPFSSYPILTPAKSNAGQASTLVLNRKSLLKGESSPIQIFRFDIQRPEPQTDLTSILFVDPYKDKPSKKGYAANVPHALNEQAKHIAYLIKYGLDHKATPLRPQPMQKQTQSGSQPLTDLPVWGGNSTLNAHRIITTMKAKAMAATAFSPVNMVAGRLSFLRFLTTGAPKMI